MYNMRKRGIEHARVTREGLLTVPSTREGANKRNARKEVPSTTPGGIEHADTKKGALNVYQMRKGYQTHVT